MPSPQIIRTAHSGIDDSPMLRLFGQWNDGFVFVAHEAVLFQVSSNGIPSPVDATKMDGLQGAVVQTTAGLDIGKVFSFSNPLFGPQPISPIVRLQPEAGVKYTKWAPNQALAVSNFQADMAVRLDNGTQGNLIDPGDGKPLVAERPYLEDSNPTTVRVVVLHFSSNLRFLAGMPVLVDGGAHDGRLVGMLFNLQAAGGETVAYCSPAAFWAS